jgi:hypothetical protein
MPSSGPRYPTAVETYGASGSGWTNPGNALNAPNDTYASSSIAAGGGTETLVLEAFGFAVPADAVISGVQLDVQAKRTGGPVDLTAQLGNGLTVVGAAKLAAVNTLEGTLTYGGDKDLWSAVLTPGIVNSGITVHLTASAPGASSVIDLDSAGLTITYFVPTGDATPPRRMTLGLGLGPMIGTATAAAGGGG